MYDSDPLDADRLRDLLLVPGGLWTSVDVVARTGSTNVDLAERARAGAPAGSLLLTGYQSGGRGRLNRSWTAPPGSSIAMSALVRPAGVEPSRWTWLPLLAGLAVTEGLRRATGVDAVLKWPNDVLIDDRKVCGILAERVDNGPGERGSVGRGSAAAPAGTAPGCVIGMGINVDLGVDDLPVPSATSLALAGATTLNRTTIAVTVLRALALLYDQWAGSLDPAAEDASLAQAYVNRCSTIGRRVRVELGGNDQVVGTAEAVDTDGRLAVRSGDGVRLFGAGDVVHLR